MSEIFDEGGPVAVRVVCVGSPRLPGAPRRSSEHPETVARWQTPGGHAGVSQWLTGDELAVSTDSHGDVTINSLVLTARTDRGRSEIVCPECHQVVTARSERLRSVLERLDALGQETVTLAFLQLALEREPRRTGLQ